jgi:hypothetical protein
MSTESEHIDHLADDAVHGLLSPPEAARVARHAAICDRCDAALGAARRRLALLRSVPPVEPSAGLVPATMGRIEDARSRRRRVGRRVAWGSLGALAACVLLLTGLQIYYSRLRPTGLDLVVLGQRELLTSSRASIRVRLTDRQGNVALSGLPVLVSLLALDGTTTELARTTTDELGSVAPRFDVPDLPPGHYRLRVTAGAESITRPVELKRSWKLMLSSDRPVYQPGQKILVRSLALRRPDLRPVAKEQAVFTLIDPRGNVLFKETHRTSAHGISSASCELAHEIQEGGYTIVCKVGDTESKLSVEVKRYVLPKFQVSAKLDRPYYAPGQTVRVEVKAAYFFGKPVADGAVDLILIDNIPGDAKPITAKGKTDDKGDLNLTFALPKVLTGNPGVKVVVKVTDNAGQSYSRSVDCLVTNEPIQIDAVAEGGTLVRGQSNTIYVLVRKIDGTAMPGARIEVHQFEGGRNAIVAAFRADERGAVSWAMTPELLASLTPPGKSDPQFVLVVVDAKGEHLAKKNVTFALGRGVGDFLVRLDRPVYKAGQTMTISAFGAGVEPVFVDLIRDGQTFLSTAVEMADGKGEHVVDLPPDVSGTLQLVAYRFDPTEGLPRRKLRIVQVQPAEGVKITATLDKAEYAPRADATLNVRLTDAAGKPLPGAVSLAAVDEAVFSVLSLRPGMEQAFYSLEQELLKPVYAIYPAWMPGAGADFLERDRALFAHTAAPIDPDKTFSPGHPGFAAQIAPVGPQTMAVRTLPMRQQETLALKRMRHQQIAWGWAGLILVSILAGYAALWVCVPTGTVLKIHGVGMVLFMVLGMGMILSIVLFGGGVKTAFDAVGSKMATSETPMPMRLFGVDKFDLSNVDRGDDDGVPLAYSLDGIEAASVHGAPPRPRVRNYFPETLLWRPDLVTDDQGKLDPLTFPLADSITTWRLSASAVTSDGRLGGLSMPVKVFQPFFVDLNLPVALTRGDEVGVPVVVYNYSDKPQTVKLTLSKQEWFTLNGAGEQSIELAPGEVRGTRFPIRVAKVGTHKLRLTALAGTIGDAIEREIEVVPDGRKVETTLNGSLDRSAEHTLTVPEGVIDGSVKAFVKVYPSGFSQLVEGLDGIFRMPSGCFEQTSSTTYPNVLALDYLRRNRLSVPEVEAKARQYIHLGYQRLVGFEVNGGGFDWYGRPPASVNLTAYGLMQFEDMAKVHDVDPALIARTRNWILSKRTADGSWKADAHGANLTGGGYDAQTLPITAYIAWAVFAGGKTKDPGDLTRRYLLSYRPEDIQDPHALALVANAILALEPQGESAAPYLDRLDALRQKAQDGRLVFWNKAAGTRTGFYGQGQSANIETTAIAALALHAGKRYPDSVRGALAWLVSQKDPNGTWHSTQPTVFALKALLVGSEVADDKQADRAVALTVGDHLETLTVQPEVLKLVEITKHLKPGANRIVLTEKAKSGMSYQVVFRYHVPEAKKADESGPLSIALAYDRTTLALNETIRVKATIVNRQATPAPMVMLDLPIPPGFTARSDDFEKLVAAGRIGKYQIRARGVLVYLRGLEPAKPLVLEYALQAQMVVKAAVPGARVYEYYDPAKRGESKGVEVVVK